MSMKTPAFFPGRNLSGIRLILSAATAVLALVGSGHIPAASIAAAARPAARPHGNALIATYEPALAVRASACVTCHAKIRPSQITDFGYGDPYFFGQRVAGSAFGTFDGSIYGDFYGGEPNKTGWLTAQIGKNVIVPKAPVDFDLRAAGSKLPDSYQKALQAKSLAGYLRTLESQKPNPATVIEKEKVFIGAPTAAVLEARFGISPGSGIQFKYLKSDPSSPEVAGIGLSANRDYFTNTGEIVCDGDLFIRGALFLNRADVSTVNGCRIYATGPVFVQHAIRYKSPGAPTDRTNLQLVSAEAILLGVGNKSCDAADKDSPLSRRLVSGYAISTFFTREAYRQSISPKAHGQTIYDQGMKIAGLEDASCRDTMTGFSRLLLNAPQVHNRYKGKFQGLVIGEIVLFRPGSADLEFDPVFREVSVLPRLRDSDYLRIQ